jgi:hypothetical protein
MFLLCLAYPAVEHSKRYCSRWRLSPGLVKIYVPLSIADFSEIFHCVSSVSFFVIGIYDLKF